MTLASQDSSGESLPPPARTQKSSALVPLAPSFTLSFGGVDFCLAPDTSCAANGSDASLPLLSLAPRNLQENEILLDLSSFTGTLRVSRPRVESLEHNVLSAKVEDEPPSPPRNNQPTSERTRSVGDPPPETHSPAVSPSVSGQQKLPFAKANETPKKRGRPKKNDAEKSSNALSSMVTPDITGHLKRALQDDGGRATPKPMPVKKKTRNQQEPRGVTIAAGNAGRDRPSTPTLGQVMPSQSTGNGSDAEDDMEAVVPLTADKCKPKKAATSSSVQELVKRAESCTENEAGIFLHDDDSVASSIDMKNEGSTIMELDECLDAENKYGGKVGSHAADSLLAQNLSNRAQIPACPRWGHTMSLIDHSRIVVYGGQATDKDTNKFMTLSDLHVYDVSKRTWTRPVNCEGVPRQWHTATFLPERQLLISFGGESTNPKTGRTTTTDQVMVLDTEIMLWYPPSVSGSVPSGRSGHSASLLQNTNELVVFGGVKGQKWQNSVAVLDTTRWKWSSPKIAGDAPRPRSYHTATAISGSAKNSNRLVIFGGNNDNESFDSVHVLDAQEGSKWAWCHPNVTGTPPCPRTGHTATLLEDNKTILIYGGWDPTDDENVDETDEEMIFKDSFLLDTELWSWSKGPKPRYDGGRPQNGGMKNVAQNGGPRRVGHSAVLAPGEEGAQVLVFGGRIPNDEFSADFQTLVVPRSMVGLGT